MNHSTDTARTRRAPHLRWVPIAKMRVSPRAQRTFSPAHAAALAASFDLEAMGYPVVNLRADGLFYIVDAQHRVEALKLLGWADQQLQCECYEGLTEADEADLFLMRNKRRTVSAFEKFRIALVADLPEETDIDRVVRANGLKISQDRRDGSVSAVGALTKVYRRGGPGGLGRTLRIIRDAYGTPGLDAHVIDGIGLLCHRYNGELPDKQAAERLSGVLGGVSGLAGRAENLRKKTGVSKATGVAAAAVEIINSGRGGAKLPSWWKNEGSQ